MNLVLRGIAGLLFGVLVFACGRGLTYRTETTSSPNSAKAVTLRQIAPNGQNAGPTNLTPPMLQVPIVGNTIIVAAWAFGPTGGVTGSSASDGPGNTYTLVDESYIGNIYVAIFYATITNPSAGLQVTVTFSGPQQPDFSNVVASEFTEILTASPLDQLAGSTGNSNSAAVGPTPGSTDQPNELVVAATALSTAQGFITPSIGYFPIFTDVGTYATGQMVFQTTSSMGQQSASWDFDTPADSASVIATFRATY